MASPASQVRNDRLAVSLASRKLRAVEPVRGSPSPNSGATISCSAISGCRAYHCSTSSRLTRRPTIWSIITLSPNSLSADSAVSEPTRTSRPSPTSLHRSRPNPPAPLRSRPVARRVSPWPPVPRPGCAGTSATPYGITPLDSGSDTRALPANPPGHPRLHVVSCRSSAAPRQVEIPSSRTARAAVFPRARWRTAPSCPPPSAEAAPGPSARGAALGPH